ncbi:fimbrial protein [Parabacteroides sp.]
MLFKRLFLAMFAALALAGCSDNDTDPEIIDAAKGDVIVTFAATSSEQITTRSEAATETGTTIPGYEKFHNNFVPTSEVSEYCLMTNAITDKEFVIDHLTVFIFDEQGKLVKTSYFDSSNDKKEVASGGSIYQFGGIVLKQGTYKFVLAGNISHREELSYTDLIFPNNVGMDYDNFREHIEIGSGLLCDTEGDKVHLPMICFLNNVDLTAYKSADGTPTATLNVIYDATGDVVIPKSETDETDISIPQNATAKSILLDRLVARVQLQSIKYAWDQVGAENFKISLLGAALVNAAEKSYVNPVNNGVGSDGGIMNGSFTPKNTWYKPEDAKDAMSMVYYDGEIVPYYKKDIENVILNNNGKGHFWSEDNKSTVLLPVSFYAYAKSGIPEGMNSNYELMLVLKCKVNDEEAPVYYYVPLRNGTESGTAAVEANKVYNVNVTLAGDGSDEAGKKKETIIPKVNITVGEWGYHEIKIDGEPNKD